MTQETIRIFVVDDHFVVRRGLVSFLNVSNDLQVVGETDNGEDAITHCEDLMDTGIHAQYITGDYRTVRATCWRVG